MSDPSEFASSDESIEVDYIDYLDELLSDDEIIEIESLQTDTIEVYSELDFEGSV